jgi:hypothetical protein
VFSVKYEMSFIVIVVLTTDLRQFPKNPKLNRCGIILSGSLAEVTPSAAGCVCPVFPHDCPSSVGTTVSLQLHL